ncbi:MAG: chloride channel protein [Dissulfurimicrobium sp.]|uniref:chloride channel protein n=1 Tax=Dissulfurimicrobium TaxID=1769732 RepID=UPI001EDC5618|nr:chloride channel protein [Dissulfurimicrobium hydrothermale]UKL13106.1 chloride channel protein [Dissulfurimicrobium hydrothermale]
MKALIPSDLPQPAYNTSSDLHLLRMLALAIAVGILGAFAVLSFRWLLIFSETCIYGTRLGLVADAAMLPPLLRAVSPAIGGLLAGLILEYLAGQGKGKNGADYMEAIVAGRDLPARDSLLKSAASAASVVSGGSIGREGSMVQLAALTGSAISDWLHSAPSERHFLIACGAAAGVAGAYNTPIAGSLFVAEIVLGGITISRLGPLLLASTVSDLVVRHITHVGPIYAAAPGKLSTAPELMLVALLGIGAGVLGSVFVRLMDTTHNAFRHLTLPLWIKMATAGLAVGTLSTIRPEVWGNGYSVINSLLHRPHAWDIVLLILILKTAATILTTGSGAVGGVFTPTLFVGAALGSLGGSGIHMILSGASENAYAIVGMGAFLAAVTHAPLTSVIMVSEMTFGFTLVPALTLGCLSGYYVSASLHPASVYGHSKPPTHPTEHLDTGS